MFLSFTEYQNMSADTRIYPSEVKITYPALGLSGEAGEVAEQVKKALRDDGGQFTPERREALKKEMGDVLWYLAALCDDLGIDLGEVAQMNIDKLQSRKERNVLSGSGNDR